MAAASLPEQQYKAINQHSKNRAVTEAVAVLGESFRVRGAKQLKDEDLLVAKAAGWRVSWIEGEPNMIPRSFCG